MTSTTTNPFELDDIIVVTKDITIPLLGSKPYLIKGSILKVIKTDYYTTNLGDYNMQCYLIDNNNKKNVSLISNNNLFMIIKADVDNGSIINRQKLRQQNIDQIMYETT